MHQLTTVISIYLLVLSGCNKPTESISDKTDIKEQKLTPYTSKAKNTDPKTIADVGGFSERLELLTQQDKTLYLLDTSTIESTSFEDISTENQPSDAVYLQDEDPDTVILLIPISEDEASSYLGRKASNITSRDGQYYVDIAVKKSAVAEWSDKAETEENSLNLANLSKAAKSFSTEWDASSFKSLRDQDIAKQFNFKTSDELLANQMLSRDIRKFGSKDIEFGGDSGGFVLRKSGSGIKGFSVYLDGKFLGRSQLVSSTGAGFGKKDYSFLVEVPGGKPLQFTVRRKKGSGFIKVFKIDGASSIAKRARKLEYTLSEMKTANKGLLDRSSAVDDLTKIIQKKYQSTQEMASLLEIMGQIRFSNQKLRSSGTIWTGKIPEKTINFTEAKQLGEASSDFYNALSNSTILFHKYSSAIEELKIKHPDLHKEYIKFLRAQRKVDNRFKKGFEGLFIEPMQMLAKNRLVGDEIVDGINKKLILDGKTKHIGDPFIALKDGASSGNVRLRIYEDALEMKKKIPPSALENDPDLITRTIKQMEEGNFTFSPSFISHLNKYRVQNQIKKTSH